MRSLTGLASGVMRCTFPSLALICLASWARAEFTWPTDSSLRASFLQKRGLVLFGEDNLDKLKIMKARIRQRSCRKRTLAPSAAAARKLGLGSTL